MEETRSAAFNKGLRDIWKIWGGIIFSLFIYIRLCYLLESKVPYLVQYDLPLDLIKYIIFALSIFALYMNHYFRRKLMTGEDPKSDIKIIERSKKLDKPPVIGKYTNSVVVSLAILEFIGILGFLYFLISGDFQTLYILVVVSGIAMIYYRPKMKELDDVSIVSEANISSLNQGMQPTE